MKGQLLLILFMYLMIGCKMNKLNSDRSKVQSVSLTIIFMLPIQMRSKDILTKESITHIEDTGTTILTLPAGKYNQHWTHNIVTKTSPSPQKISILERRCITAGTERNGVSMFFVGY
jgi:hypothetical protein